MKIKMMVVAVAVMIAVAMVTGCVKTTSEKVYVHQNVPVDRLILKSGNDFILTGPAGFAGTCNSMR